MFSKKTFSWILAFASFFGFSSCKKESPNIILFVVDDLGWKDLSIEGSEFYETPNIDNLANQGVRFTNSYAAHPRCVPSRYALHTGKYPSRAGIPGRTDVMVQEEKTLGEAMQENGYTTFFIGKWHLGHDEAHWPQNQGYDINIGGCSAGAPISYFAPFNTYKKATGHKARQIIGFENAVPGTYITDYITDETVQFIKEQKSKPFFAFVGHYAVHTPLEAKPEKIKKYQRKLENMHFEGADFEVNVDGRQRMHQNNPVYAAMIESVDESLGRLIQTLKEEGIYDNTIIILTSDHGGLSNSGPENLRPLATSNLPLRAGKGHIYDGGIKIPTIVKGGNGKAGTINNSVIVNTDIFPTVLELVNLPLQPKAHLDGHSFANALQGETINQNRTFFWHSPTGRPTSTGDHNTSVIRKGDYKLFHYYDVDSLELYNLIANPYEQNNIRYQFPIIADSLFKSMELFKEEIHAFEKKN